MYFEYPVSRENENGKPPLLLVQSRINSPVRSVLASLDCGTFLPHTRGSAQSRGLRMAARRMRALWLLGGLGSAFVGPAPSRVRFQHPWLWIKSARTACLTIKFVKYVKSTLWYFGKPAAKLGDSLANLIKFDNFWSNMCSHFLHVRLPTHFFRKHTLFCDQTCPFSYNTNEKKNVIIFPPLPFFTKRIW